MRQNQTISYIKQGKIDPKRKYFYYKPASKNDFDSLVMMRFIRGKRDLFCKELRRARIIKGISQTDLARCMGVDQNYISRVETGKVNVSFDKLISMAYYLDCIVCLFGETVFDKKDKN